LLRLQKEEEIKLKEEAKRKKELASYDSLFDPELMITNRSAPADDDDDDDFM
jgi:hypothetical protein